MSGALRVLNSAPERIGLYSFPYLVSRCYPTGSRRQTRNLPGLVRRRCLSLWLFDPKTLEVNPRDHVTNRFFSLPLMHWVHETSDRFSLYLWKLSSISLG